MIKKLKTLKDIIPATSDYNLSEGQQISKEIRDNFHIREDWNGYMSGEWARIQLRQAAKEWIEDREEQLLHLKDTLKDDISFPYNYQIIANGLQSQIHILKHIFNLEEE